MSYTPWWNYPFDNPSGETEPFGGGQKPDSNVQLPAGYPIVAILPGTITGIDTTSAWGCSLTIKLDAPLNALATHTSYLHLAGFATGIALGAHVNAGDLIGYNGGSQACGSQKVPLGFALYSGDNYGFGSAYNVLLDDLQTGANLLNPFNLLTDAKSGTLPQLQNLTYNIGAGIPGIDWSWLTSSPLWGFISDPTRLLKVASGVMLIGIALLLLLAPEAKQAGKVALLA